MDFTVQTALTRMQTEDLGVRATAATRIFDDLRQRILSLDLPPGTSLLRAQLAEEYEVSQTPLRDALQRLEQHGMIRIFPQSRTLVTKINLEQTATAMFLRMALECEVVTRLAADAAPELLAHLRLVNESKRALIHDTAQLRVFQQLDEYFHYLLFQGVNQLNLHRLLRSQTADMDRVRRLQTHSADRLATIVQGHDDLIAALDNRDPEQAVAALRDHLHKPDDWADGYKRDFPDYFA